MGRVKQEAESDDTSSRAKPSKKLARRGTHVLRKEEREQLTVQLAQLESEKEHLKQRKLMRPDFVGQNESQQQVIRRLLQEEIQNFQQALAGGQALFSEYLHSLADTPLHCRIHLRQSSRERRQTCTSLQPLLLDSAKKFMEARLGQIDVTRTFGESQRFDTDAGDVFSSQCFVDKFEAVASLRQVYDTFVYFLSNAEICMSETLGLITIREDDDNYQDSVRQNRLVSSTRNGEKLESNLLIFSEIDERNNSAIIVTKSVDQDDLLPYQPDKRVRRDLDAIYQLSTRYIGGNFVAILKRWTHCRLFCPSIPISRSAWQAMADSTDGWVEMIIDEIYNRVGSRAQ